MSRPLTIGVIADTHGLLREEAIAALRGCDRLIHAGDIGKPEILTTLAALAPLDVIRGNNDETLPWAADLPDVLDLELEGVRIYLLHDRKQLAFDPAARDVQVVIAGHSHKPLIETRNAVLYLNPGSAGPRRFSLPISVAYLRLDDGRAEAELVTLG
ncbi:metallophosphoesterase family protein [Stutzerimonas urumqiensis]|uniref:metallophosphoesterase family protein n=1 Tax=Stutzerimonas urumqiensis TaxID=638269 RepID=UPI000EB19E5F|nr:metallophosphoesterase family protein [Stutzerimonas urumqiensis]